jgi:uncharacterized protein YdeI (BOF family)
MKARTLAVRVVQFWLLALTIVLGYASAGVAEDTKPSQILITNVNVFDGKSDKLAEGMSVLIEGNLIKKIGTDLVVSQGWWKIGEPA